MKKTAGLVLVLAILGASALLFYYAFRPDGSAAPSAPDAASVPAAPVVEPSAPAAGAGDTEEAPLEPGGSAATPGRPEIPSGPVEPAGITAGGKKLSGSATVTGEAVNVRGTNEFRTDRANVVAKAKKGERVKLLGVEKEKAGPHLWYHVKLNDGTVGWIRDDLLKLE